MTTKTCLKCGGVTNEKPTPLMCPHCGAVYAKVEELAAKGVAIRAATVKTPEQLEEERRQARLLEENPELRHAASIERGWSTGDWSGVPQEMLIAEAAKIVQVTTDEVPGRSVAAVRGIISGESAYAFGAIGEMFGGLLRNIAGSGSSSATTSLLKTHRVAALDALRAEAMRAGADAVLGVKIDYEEFSGANGHGVMVVVATGTGVRLKT